MELPNNLTSLNEALTKLPQQRIAKVISVLLLIYIAYIFSQLTWLIVPQAELASASNNINRVTSMENKSANININKIQNLNLFGIHNALPTETKVEMQDAPETRLNLTLSGVVASSEPSTAAAIIENNGKQETYGIGELITGTKAVLESVARDRVLIKQAGRLETLMLDGFSYNKADHLSSTMGRKQRKKQTFSPSPSPTLKASVIDKRGDKSLREKFSHLKSAISDEPGKIIDYLKIAPKRKDGAVVGYRLMPGKDADFFKLSGLKRGDVAVQMNGLDLTIASQAAQALSALKQEQEVSLLVDRNGEMTEILFSVN
jgi:general secretion pathway protein C